MADPQVAQAPSGNPALDAAMKAEDEARRKRQEAEKLTIEQRRLEAERLKKERKLGRLGEGGVGGGTRDAPAPTRGLMADVGDIIGVPTDEPVGPEWVLRWLGTQAVGIPAGIGGLGRTAQDLLILDAQKEMEENKKRRAAEGRQPSAWERPLMELSDADREKLLLPTSEDLEKLAFKVLPFQPAHLKGPVGKMIEGGVQSWGGGLLTKAGRSAVGQFANALGGTVGEGVGQVADAVTDNPVIGVGARLLGSAGGTAAGNLAGRVRPTAGKMLADRLEGDVKFKRDPRTGNVTVERSGGISKEELDEAVRLQRFAKNELGIDLLPHEALPAGVRGPLQGLTSDVGASAAGGAVQRKVQERIPGIQAAHQKKMDELTAGVVPDPQKVSGELARSAGAAIKEPQGARSKIADINYKNAANDFVPGQRMQGIVNDIDAKLMTLDPDSGVAKELMELKKRLLKDYTVTDSATGEKRNMNYYQTNVGNLHAVLDDFENVRLATAFDKPSEVSDATRTAVQPFLKQVRDAMIEHSPDYKAGRAYYEGVETGAGTRYNDPTAPARTRTQEQIAVDEANASAARPIYDASKPNPQTGSVPPNTAALDAFKNLFTDPNVTPGQIRDGLRRLDPEARTQALRLYMEHSLNKAFEPTLDTGGAPNPKGGGKYTKDVVGTTDPNAPGGDRGKKLYAAAHAATGDATFAEGLRRLDDVIARTGIGIKEGSPTAGRQATGKEATPPVPTVADPLKPATKWFDDWRFKKNYGELAKILTDPDSVAKIRHLALAAPGSERAQRLVRQIMTGAQTAGSYDPDKEPAR